MPGAYAATNTAQNLLASTVVTAGTSAVYGEMALGTGTGTLSSGLTNGVATTTLSVNALSQVVPAGQFLTLIYQTHTAIVQATLGAAVGATSITITSFTPSFSFPSGTGLIRTPGLSDTALDSEQTRLAITPDEIDSPVVSPLVTPPFTIGPGSATVFVYCPPTIATATYLEVGFFAGSLATSAAGSGVLTFRAPIYWAHTLNLDSFTVLLSPQLAQI